MSRVSPQEIENPLWINCIRKAIDEDKLLGTTCHLYSKKQPNRNSLPSHRCLCGRLPRPHSFNGQPKTERIADGYWKPARHTKKSTVTVYGIWNNKTKFIRWDPDQVESSDPDKTNLLTMAEILTKTEIPAEAQILTNDVANKKLILLVSCFGGAKYFKMSDKLEKDFMDGIGQIAATEGVWLLSTGLNSGVSKVIGQSVERRTLLSEKKANYTVIGLTSWGCLSERTRQVFRQQARKYSNNPDSQRRESIIELDIPRNNQGVRDLYSTLDENEPDTFENNHTHFLMIDDGSEGERKTENEEGRCYLTDQPRSDLVHELKELTKCHSVTILIEGGLDSFDVIRRDLDAKRPVVIIHGSGRCATVIGNLLELTRDQIKIGQDEIDRQLKKHIITKPTQQEILKKYYGTIYSILEHENRSYLTVFKLDNNTSLTDTIFLAIYEAQINDNSDNSNDRAKALLDLAVTWNCGNGIDDVLENNQLINFDQKLNTELFEKALTSNRPVFVDYFLRRQYNILETTEFIDFKNDPNEKIRKQTITRSNVSSSNDQDDLHKEDDANVRAAFARKFIVKKLYENRIDHLEKSYQIHSFADLDHLYHQLIGPYAQSFFHVQSTKDRIVKNLNTIIRCLSKYFYCYEKNPQKPPEDNEPAGVGKFIEKFRIDQIPKQLGHYVCSKKFDNEEMFRDLYLWSVISGYAEMSFIFLLQIRSRIIASLIAAGITSLLVSTKDGYLDQWHKFHKQSEDYEKFARECIDACYERNQQKACQLILREMPLFGKVTCMQVAISFRIKSFINSRCFNQVLNRQWYGTLDQTTNKTLTSKIFFILSIISFGLLAPWLLKYRNDRMDNGNKEDSDLIWKGVHDQNSDEMNYIKKVEKFHRSPIVRMSYHFLVYIWMLLAFSYFMLFEIKSSDQPIHWTEIYVIVTISAMLIEDIRRVLMEYLSLMLERWDRKDLWIISLYTLPYILFYIGIGLHFRSKQQPDLFTSAKIVLALDLELWFLFSLRFVSAIKLLGPKLFMMRNMLRVLGGFVYIIFVCIAAYGIVSRSLVMFDDLEFTAKNLSYSIFYRPYWFLYSIVDDERNDLNDITQNSSSTSDAVAEAITVQILFVFQMLFINILILNLLIAVFNFTINDVQDKSEYLWRYQRYELIREYFEKPHLAYPPLSLLGYLYIIGKLIRDRRNVFRIFKRFNKDEHKDWTKFENAATYNYTRTFVDRMYRDSSTLVIPTFSEIDELKTEVESLKRDNNQMHAIIDRMDVQGKRMIPAMNWIMTAMNRVKMSSPSQRPPPLVTTSN